MSITLITYATRPFRSFQRLNTLTARRAGIDHVYEFGPKDLDHDFAKKHAGVLQAPRGAGFWLWKPYLVQRTLAALPDGAILVYTDAAMHFVTTIDPILRTMDKHALDVLLLGEAFVEAHYTKRDAFLLLGLDQPRYTQSPQRFASAFALRKTLSTMELAARYLSAAEDRRILTDIPNTQELGNYAGFVAHRHDQSILSLLSKQAEIPVVASGLVAEGAPERSTQVINHTRLHLPFGELVRNLLVQRVIRPTDLQGLATVPARCA